MEVEINTDQILSYAKKSSTFYCPVSLCKKHLVTSRTLLPLRTDICKYIFKWESSEIRILENHNFVCIYLRFKDSYMVGSVHILCLFILDSVLS